jgi:hypothetical protein
MIEARLMRATRDHARSRMLEQHVATQFARDRIARALYEATVDGVAFGPRDLPTGDDREWIRNAIAGAIPEATEVALHVLAWRIGQAMEAAPEGLLERFDASHEWEELGLD